MTTQSGVFSYYQKHKKMGTILTRSPYFVNVTESGIVSASINIFIYEGMQTTSRPSTPTYVLTDDAYDGMVSFEFAELIKDYISTVFDGSVKTHNVWCDYQVTWSDGTTDTPLTMIQESASEGWGYRYEGVNPKRNNSVLMSNDIVVKNENTSFWLPISGDTNSRVMFFKNGELKKLVDVNKTNDSSELIQYITSDGSSFDEWYVRCLYDGAEFKNLDHIKEVLDESLELDIDKVIIDSDGGSKTIYVENINEGWYDINTITFINSHGALQEMFFFKASTTSMKVDSTNYKSTIQTGGTYNPFEHSNKILDSNGTQTMKLNSGFYPEAYNDVFTELLLSESVWLTNKGIVYPVNILTKAVDFKTHKIDQLINHELEIEFSGNIINDIR